MPKPHTPRQQQIPWQFLRFIRTYWIVGLTILLMVNAVAIGYVVITADQQDDVQITYDSTRQISTQDQIVIRFSTPMIQSTVANALQISPAHPHQLVWADDSQQLSIMPESPWPHHTPYTIRLTTNAQSQSGRRLQRAWSMQFTPQRVVQIRQVLPPPNHTDVARDGMIVVRFGQQMVAQSSVGRTLDTTLLQIFPPVRGVSKWLDMRTLAFQADEFAPNQEYTITVPTQLRDVNGAPLQSSYTWRFRTMATRIERTTPANNSQEVGLQQSLVMTMTGQIDAVRLAQTLVISPSVVHQIQVTPIENSNARIDIVPQLGWQSDTQYTVNIGGGESTLAPFSTTFRTVPALQLVARTPGDGEIVGRDREVRFIFNTLLDTTSITDAITITPAPIQPAQITTTGRDIRITANWEVQVNPIIQISSALRNTNGITLTTPISSELRIDQRQALVTLPGIPGDIYDVSTTNTFQVQTIPNRTALLRIYDVPVATLVRMLDMDVATFLNVDPARYNLPLLAQQELQGNDANQRITVDVMRDVQRTPLSRIWLIQLISSNGSQDVRLMRTRPATLHVVSVPQHLAVGLYEGQGPLPDRDILLFQSGQLVNQGKSDDRGIWQTSLYSAGQQFVVVDPQQPIDAQRFVALNTTAEDLLQMVIDRNHATPGATINALIVRKQRTSVIASLRVRRIGGDVMSEQQLILNADVPMTSARVRIPNQLRPGRYIVEVAIDDQLAQQTLLVHTTQHKTAQVSHTIRDAHTVIRVRDANGQAYSNQMVYWRSSTASGQGMTDTLGEYAIAHTTDDIVVMIETRDGSVLHTIPMSTTPTQLLIHSTRQWERSDQPVDLRLKIVGDIAPRDMRAIQLTAQNEFGQDIPSQTVITNAEGVADTQLILTSGQWRVTATSDDLQATTTIWVDQTRNTTTFEPEYTTLVQGQTPRWMYPRSITEPVLMAQSMQPQITVDWTQTDASGIIQSVPISQTGVLHSAIAQAGQPYYHAVQRIIDPACPTTIPITVEARDQQLLVRLTYLPTSRILLSAFDDDQQRLIGENITLVTDENGIVTWQTPDNANAKMISISVVALRDTCYLAESQYAPVVRAQTLTLNAPPIVRIGDIVSVTARIKDALPAQTSRVRVSPEGLQIIDTLPQYTVVSDQQGDAQLTWRYRVTAERVRLAIESSQSPNVTWQPTVITPLITYSNDGFVLRGTTSLEKGGDPPVLLDIIVTPQQLQQALSKTPYDQTNPSHVAHRIWHTVSPTDQASLMQQLIQQKLANGAWGWAGSLVADPLITADVVIALTQAQQSMQPHQGALRYLQQQLQNPQLPATIRAIVGYALALNQLLPAEDLLALSRTPHVLGNEGLAALLLSTPPTYAYTIPPVLSELLQRVQTAPRGLWWASDSATASLHNRENVNALIFQALAHLNVAPDQRTQLGTQLLSMRGVNGWSDSISNARIWAYHQQLLPTFNASNFISMLNDTGQTIHTGVMSPAQPVTQNSQIQSNSHVVVGIARPRNPPVPTGEAAIWLQMYRQDGQRVDDEATLSIGDEITVHVNIAFFSAIPHVSIIDPQSTFSTVVTQPSTSTILYARNAPGALILHATIDTPQVVQYRYRIRMNYLGRSLLEPIEVRDGSGTIHAQSQAVMVYVVAP